MRESFTVTSLELAGTNAQCPHVAEKKKCKRKTDWLTRLTIKTDQPRKNKKRYTRCKIYFGEI